MSNIAMHQTSDIATLADSWSVDVVSRAGKVKAYTLDQGLLAGKAKVAEKAGNDLLALRLRNAAYGKALAMLTHPDMFPVSVLKKAPGVTVDKEGVLHLTETIDADTSKMVRLNVAAPNRAAMMGYARAVVWLASTKKLSATKCAAAETLAAWLGEFGVYDLTSPVAEDLMGM